MEGHLLQAARGYRLDAAGSLNGVSCDKQGPSLGPIRLLVKSIKGFAPRPLDQLNSLLSRTFQERIDCSTLIPGLRATAAALNEGDLARAMIATQFLRLPILSEAEALRAIDAEQLFKASPDDPKHPGYPAGAPDSRGGQFEPKDGDAAPDDTRINLDELRGQIKRNAIRAGLRKLLNWRRISRIAGEGAADIIPGAEEVGIPLTALDILQTAKDVRQLKIETDAALDFISKGPHNLDDLRVSLKDETFPNYDAFVKDDFARRFGPAGDGYQYHHIVEQRSGAIGGAINSTRNIIRIPKLIHQEISIEYGQSLKMNADELMEPRLTIRRSLKGKSFDELYEHGVEMMKKMGILY